MNKLSQSLAIGLAMFSMFFGAGNIIYPLAVGQMAGNDNFYAMSGLILTAAIMPIAGVIAMILFDGNYREFFGRLGKTPGFLLAMVIISLLGPLGSTPRCIALSYATLKGSFLDISPTLFSGIACFTIFLFSIRKNRMLTLLAWVLTPLLLAILVIIIFMGCSTTPEIPNTNGIEGSAFLHGLKEGYMTMDLLAAFFFSSTILNILRRRSNEFIGIALRASVVGAFLLSAIYVGFSYIAAFHGGHLTDLAKDELLSAITLRIAGDHAGMIACIAIALACLTTAIALVTAFTDFFQKEVFKEKISYEITMIGALLITFFVSTYEFTGISSFLGPILDISYPGLILLTFLNIAFCLKNFKPIKVPVFAAFTLSAYLYFFQN